MSSNSQPFNLKNISQIGIYFFIHHCRRQDIAGRALSAYSTCMGILIQSAGSKGSCATFNLTRPERNGIVARGVEWVSAGVGCGSDPEMVMRSSSPAVSHCRQTDADVPTNPGRSPGCTSSLDPGLLAVRPTRMVGPISSALKNETAQRCCWNELASGADGSVESGGVLCAVFEGEHC